MATKQPNAFLCRWVFQSLGCLLAKQKEKTGSRFPYAAAPVALYIAKNAVACDGGFFACAPVREVAAKTSVSHASVAGALAKLREAGTLASSDDAECNRAVCGEREERRGSKSGVYALVQCPSSPFPAPENHFVEFIDALNRVIEARSEGKMGRDGYYVDHFTLLALFSRLDADGVLQCGVSEIAALYGLDKATVSRTVRTLRELGVFRADESGRLALAQNEGMGDSAKCKE